MHDQYEIITIYINLLMAKSMYAKEKAIQYTGRN